MPAIALSHPTAIAGSINGSPYNSDDDVFSVVLPVNITMYNQSSANIRVSTNGLLGLGDLNNAYLHNPLPFGGEQGFTTYPDCTNSPQPYTNPDTGVTYPNSCFGDSDLAINYGTQQGIYYEIDGAAPSRRTSFEFYLSTSSDPTLFYHFLVNFYENRSNVVNYQYLNVTDSGVDSTVGVEKFSARLYQQFSYQKAIVCDGLQLTFDTTPGVNSLHIDSPGVCEPTPTT
ncbi:hypothetical protein E4T44_03282 [Aureobasidium sp. EXF-8845]|nr:hypothetical protein E4T44_03282 [Aureobasidium sp. EXF-8845]KAI4855997.1 hypothetical protein E4T45_02549 [Aureobasidium sp. EXF-8846]